MRSLALHSAHHPAFSCGITKLVPRSQPSVTWNTYLRAVAYSWLGSYKLHVMYAGRGYRGEGANAYRGGRRGGGRGNDRWGGVSGARGGNWGGAQKQRREPRPPSYGIVPWALVNGEWYFLVQMGYSAKKHDFKVDPLRGQEEEAETNWQTAVRECHEESGKSIVQTEWLCVFGFLNDRFAVWFFFQQSCSSFRAWPLTRPTHPTTRMEFIISASSHPTWKTLQTTILHSCAHPLIEIETSY